jgi:hypothetical protein
MHKIQGFRNILVVLRSSYEIVCNIVNSCEIARLWTNSADPAVGGIEFRPAGHSLPSNRGRRLSKPATCKYLYIYSLTENAF